ncbi:MAG: UTP--glucose-1-phosphate uridylyltransferase [Verrucomicrobia bacterium RIFCSPHIGHO2_12_FULL_41_10]|nr:MAG: UTP--glucose-1-phosphate uridylyltransferase [Verrucomicrobia bacterium RIFCSPHIGHO2_12_FULL_41_10]
MAFVRIRNEVKKLNRVKKAVFPIAGLGVRLLPATKASPKEMLPVVDKPLIQYAVEEAYAAGIRQMIFVTGRTKRAVEDHFDTSHELEFELKAAGKKELLDHVQQVKPDDMQCFYVRQSRALGLGHAVLCAKDLVGQEPFALLLADDIMIGDPSVMAQLVIQFNECQTSILAIENIAREHTQRYGIVSTVMQSTTNDRLIEVQSIVEKPTPELALSTLAVAGRYILTPGIFVELANQSPGFGGEIQLTDSIASLLTKEKVFAYRYHAVRYDCGSKLGFLQATVDLAERHSEVSKEFSDWLRKRILIAQE